MNAIALLSPPSPLAHVPPTDQQAAAPTLSYTSSPSPSPASSHHTSAGSPASSDTPQTASHPCASQLETSPIYSPHPHAQSHTDENRSHQAHTATENAAPHPI